MRKIQIQDESSGTQKVSIRYKTRGANTDIVTISLSKELNTRLVEIAKSQGRSRSGLINDLIEKGLSR